VRRAAPSGAAAGQPGLRHNQ
jgi:vacuolar-type H+-ATPase subunit B/Vma2